MARHRQFRIGDRIIGDDHPPLVIAEIGINHEGSLEKALKMVEDAAAVGCECVKFQCHIVDDEMIPNEVIPANSSDTIWNIMSRCALSYGEEQIVKARAEALGMIYLCTPFSRKAADRLQTMDIPAFKIGSGECNNYPLLQHIAEFGKPVILSTGMNEMASIARAVSIFRRFNVPVALLHCTSMYPTPHHLVRLGAITQMQAAFPNHVIGLSDHTEDNYACLGAVALGARILERHFTSDKSWPGPDIAISMDPKDLSELIRGSVAVFQASGGGKTVLEDEEPTIRFAFASVVTTCPISQGDELTMHNVWVKRPGTGEIRAEMFERILGRRVARNIPADTQLAWTDFLPEA
ncbi:N-acetylneuraminate synthase family protein [bacterium]|nr:N-acetylneuraminate synthase family protein [candidate division CSSED10-310 bacterium]